MILRGKNGVSFFQFPNLARFSGIEHAIFTRNGGYSEGPYRSLNVSFEVGDAQNNVAENRCVISRCIKEKNLVFAKQVHGSEVLVFAKDSRISLERVLNISQQGDAMVTDIPQIFLVIQLADCQSILMYDPVRQVVANVHSGWRGSINNIIDRTIKEMKKNFGCSPSDIIAGVSPSIGPCCAEFSNYKNEIPQNFWKYKDGNHHFDFWSISFHQLCNAGVLPHNIFLSKLCTKCNPDQFYSYRHQAITGRFAAVIGLNS